MTPQQYAVYIYLAPILAVICIFMALNAWRTRHNTESTIFLVQIFTIAAWLVLNTLELTTQTVELTLLFARLTYLPIAALPPLWLTFALAYSGRRNWLALPGYAFLWIIPALTVVLTMTNAGHHLIWRSFDFIPLPGIMPFWVVEYGPFFWVHVIFSYALLLSGSAILIARFSKSFRLYRTQALWLVMASAIPTAFNAVYILRLIPGQVKDYTPIGFALAGLLIMHAIFRFHLFDVKPVPRDAVVDYMSDGMIVLDQRDRIIDINRAARKIIGKQPGELIGRPVAECLPDWQRLIGQMQAGDACFEHLAVQGTSGMRYFDVRITQFSTGAHHNPGRLVLLQDITDRQRLMRELEELARTDPLISMFNRRHFFDLARKEIERSRRSGKPVAIILIDLDHFKQINDTYGHPAGDQVLQQVAERCQAALRFEDILARYGGEEFIVLLPETEIEQAEMVAERLRNAVENRPFEQCGETVSVTISLGVAGNQSGKEASIEELLSLADSALYCSKQLGRNRVSVCVRKESSSKVDLAPPAPFETVKREVQ
jgi:diguanylate cyclase (GGDEF)-like protein/PAS domain S-box-containing protein